MTSAERETQKARMAEGRILCFFAEGPVVAMAAREICSLLPASPKKVGVGGVCKNFNNGYPCAKEPCVFAHKCSKCGSGTHGATNCRTAPRGVASGRDGSRRRDRSRSAERRRSRSRDRRR